MKLLLTALHELPAPVRSFAAPAAASQLPSPKLLAHAEATVEALSELASSSPAAALRLRLFGFDRALLAALHGPAAQSKSFLLSAIAALGVIASVPYNRPALLQQGALQAVASALCWWLHDAAVSKAGCDALGQLFVAGCAADLASSEGALASVVSILKRSGDGVASLCDAGSGSDGDKPDKISASAALAAASAACAALSTAAVTMPQLVERHVGVARSATLRLLSDPRCTTEAARNCSVLLSSLDALPRAVAAHSEADSAVARSAEAGAGAGAGFNAGQRSSFAGPTPLAPLVTAASGSSLDLVSLPSVDADAPAILRVMSAAAGGDAASFRRFCGYGAACVLPVDVGVALQLAAAAGHADAVEVLLHSLAEDGSAGASVSHAHAEDPQRSPADAAVDATALPLAVASGPRAELLLQRLLEDWRADPTAGALLLQRLLEDFGWTAAPAKWSCSSGCWLRLAPDAGIALYAVTVLESSSGCCSTRELIRQQVASWQSKQRRRRGAYLSLRHCSLTREWMPPASQRRGSLHLAGATMLSCQWAGRSTMQVARMRATRRTDRRSLSLLRRQRCWHASPACCGRWHCLAATPLLCGRTR